MKNERYQPSVGEPFQIERYVIDKPFIRHETILFTLALLAMGWPIAAGIYGKFQDDFSHLQAVFAHMDKYLYALFGIAIGYAGD